MKFLNFILLVLLSLFLFSCTNYRLIENIDYIKVEKSYDNRIFRGIVKSSNSTILSFQSEGRIVYLPFTKGDFIKKGQVIARLDDVLYQINRDEQKAKLQEYIVQQKKQKKFYERLDVLHNVGAISDNDWENAYFELEALSAQIKMQREKIKYIDKEISFGAIIAPFDGYISNKFVDNGSYAKVASPIVEFISSEGFQIEIMIQEDLINQLNINDSVQIRIQDKKYNGKISHISKSSLNSGGYLIKISFCEIKDIKEGMSADVKLNLDNKEMILIPVSAVFEENRKSFVLKIENKNICKTEVMLGSIFGEKIEILEGIKEGDFILLNSFLGKRRIKL